MSPQHIAALSWNNHHHSCPVYNFVSVNNDLVECRRAPMHDSHHIPVLVVVWMVPILEVSHDLVKMGVLL